MYNEPVTGRTLYTSQETYYKSKIKLAKKYVPLYCQVSLTEKGIILTLEKNVKTVE